MAPVVLDQQSRSAVRPTPYRIEVRSLVACPTAVVRRTLRPEAVTRWLPRGFGRVEAELAGHAVPIAGPPFARFVTIDGQLSVESGFPVAAAIGDLGEVLASGLPGGPAVVATHEDPDQSLDVTYAAVDRWLSRHGYVAVGPHWEVYPGSVTEVVVPYR
jgi:hypothetical protein